jgi:hypothetical protein
MSAPTTSHGVLAAEMAEIREEVREFLDAAY